MVVFLRLCSKCFIIEKTGFFLYPMEILENQMFLMFSVVIGRNQWHETGKPGYHKQPSGRQLPLGLEAPVFDSHAAKIFKIHRHRHVFIYRHYVL